MTRLFTGGYMAEQNAKNAKTNVKIDSGFGIIWFIGWLFTIGFAQLVWWKIILGIVVWPLFLGMYIK